MVYVLPAERIDLGPRIRLSEHVVETERSEYTNDAQVGPFPGSKEEQHPLHDPISKKRRVDHPTAREGGALGGAPEVSSTFAGAKELHHSYPPGYTRTPFFFALVKALIGKRKRGGYHRDVDGVVGSRASGFRVSGAENARNSAASRALHREPFTPQTGQSTI